MAIFYFSDGLRKVGLEPSKVKLIRHALTDRGFRECYKANVVYEYTCHQKSGFSKGYDYWVTFISDQGTLCKLDSCYKVGAAVPDTPDMIPKGVPEIEARKFQGKNAYFHLDPLDLLKEYEGRPHQLRDLLLTREVIFTEDVEHIFGKRKWASRADEIIKANEEKERQRSIAAGDADKSETDSLSDSDDSATPPPVPEEEK